MSMLIWTRCIEIWTVTLGFRCSRCASDEFVRLLINILLVGIALCWFNSFILNIWWFFSVLHSSEQSDANCSRSTNCIEASNRFPWQAIRKKQWLRSRSLTTTWKLYWWKLKPPIPLNAVVERHFSLFFAQNEWSWAMRIFKRKYFLKEINNSFFCSLIGVVHNLFWIFVSYRNL